jgi:hypothetical protein
VVLNAQSSSSSSNSNSNSNRNVTRLLASNNVVSFYSNDPLHVFPLGVHPTLQACEDACYAVAAPDVCVSYTWHHTDFPKPQWKGHCFGHNDTVWRPVAMERVDSGCRNDLVGVHPDCSKGPGPAPPPAPPSPSPPPPPPPSPAAESCDSDFDCGGSSGVCNLSNHSCTNCKAGWKGALCHEFDFKPSSGRVAYTDPLWTWGGSPIQGEDGTVRVFRQRFTLEDAVGSHACSLEALAGV